MPPVYATASALTAELGVDLSDDAVDRLLTDAEELVDGALGARPVDSATGRRVVENDVEDWQWERVGRATVLTAAMLYRTPPSDEPEWSSQSGPDVSVSGWRGSRSMPTAAMAVLTGSGLRRLTTGADRTSRPVSWLPRGN